jgi:hypothetical protein
MSTNQKTVVQKTSVEISEEPLGFSSQKYSSQDTGKPVSIQVLKSTKLLPSLTFVAAKTDLSMSIGYHRFGNELTIRAFLAKKFKVIYPDYLFRNIKRRTLDTIFSNYVYCTTSSLQIFYRNMNFAFEKPYLKDFVDKTLVKDIPKLSRNMVRKIHELERNVDRSKMSFTKNEPKILDLVDKKQFKDGAVLSISFGKDSMLSYALLKELKIPTTLVNLHLGLPVDGKSRQKVIERFNKNEKQNVVVVKDESEKIYAVENVSTNFRHISYTNGINAMSLMLLPFSIYNQYKYMVFGNERDLDGYFMFKEKRIYPSCDQSVVYMREQIKKFKQFTNGAVQVMSVIKPVYDMAIYKILANRYPNLLQYMQSCEDGYDQQWCENCDSCAKNFLYLAPFTDPRKTNLHRYMFDEASLPFYRLFNSEIIKQKLKTTCDIDDADSCYGKITTVREQELLAFYLAYKKGYTGFLIDLFVKNYLSEAQRREKELRKRYFGVYNHTIIPANIKSRLMDIFREELSDIR